MPLRSQRRDSVPQITQARKALVVRILDGGGKTLRNKRRAAIQGFPSH